MVPPPFPTPTSCTAFFLFVSACPIPSAPTAFIRGHPRSFCIQFESALIRSCKTKTLEFVDNKGKTPPNIGGNSQKFTSSWSLCPACPVHFSVHPSGSLALCLCLSHTVHGWKQGRHDACLRDTIWLELGCQKWECNKQGLNLRGLGVPKPGCFTPASAQTHIRLFKWRTRATSLKKERATSKLLSPGWLAHPVKQGTWLFANVTRKRSFAPFCALLRSFADLRLHLFAIICAHLRVSALPSWHRANPTFPELPSRLGISPTIYKAQNPETPKRLKKVFREEFGNPRPRTPKKFQKKGPRSREQS